MPRKGLRSDKGQHGPKNAAEPTPVSPASTKEFASWNHVSEESHVELLDGISPSFDDKGVFMLMKTPKPVKKRMSKAMRKRLRRDEYEDDKSDMHHDETLDTLEDGEQVGHLDKSILKSAKGEFCPRIYAGLHANSFECCFYCPGPVFDRKAKLQWTMREHENILPGDTKPSKQFIDQIAPYFTDGLKHAIAIIQDGRGIDRTRDVKPEGKVPLSKASLKFYFDQKPFHQEAAIFKRKDKLRQNNALDAVVDKTLLGMWFDLNEQVMDAILLCNLDVTTQLHEEAREKYGINLTLKNDLQINLSAAETRVDILECPICQLFFPYDRLLSEKRLIRLEYPH